MECMIGWEIWFTGNSWGRFQDLWKARRSPGILSYVRSGNLDFALYYLFIQTRSQCQCSAQTADLISGDLKNSKRPMNHLIPGDTTSLDEVGKKHGARWSGNGRFSKNIWGLIAKSFRRVISDGHNLLQTTERIQTDSTPIRFWVWKFSGNLSSPRTRILLSSILALKLQIHIELFPFQNPPKRVRGRGSLALRHLAFSVGWFGKKVLEFLTNHRISYRTYSRKMESTGKENFIFFADPDGLPIEFYEEWNFCVTMFFWFGWKKFFLVSFLRTLPRALQLKINYPLCFGELLFPNDII